MPAWYPCKGDLLLMQGREQASGAMEEAEFRTQEGAGVVHLSQERDEECVVMSMAINEPQSLLASIICHCC